jgi:hypothetical protein
MEECNTFELQHEILIMLMYVYVYIYIFNYDLMISQLNIIITNTVTRLMCLKLL